MKNAYERKKKMKVLAENIDDYYGYLLFQKSLQEEEEREMRCNELEVKRRPRNFNYIFMTIQK